VTSRVIRLERHLLDFLSELPLAGRLAPLIISENG
jgi:hypothetical protein